MMKRPAAAPIAKWLTKDRKCDVCGRGPFAKPGLLTAHRLGEKYRFEVLEGTGRRTDNIMRTMGCETLPFINFLHSTVHHQTNEVHEGPVEFIPFGRGTTLLTLDVATMHAETLAVCLYRRRLENSWPLCRRPVNSGMTDGSARCGGCPRQ